MDKRNEEIEALRAIAVLAVIVSHFGNLAYWVPGLGEKLSRYGWSAGVDLFFVISGYVITRAFYDELRETKRAGALAFVVASRSFWLRRFFRVMPAAVVWLLIVCGCSLWFNTTGIFGTLENNFTDLASVTFNLSNLHFADCISTGNPKGCGHNGIYWSVSLEEQFYFAFPLLVLLRKRLIVVLALGVTVWMIFHDRLILDWFTRVDGLLAGVCLAFAMSTGTAARLEPSQLRRRWARAAYVLAIAGLVVLMPVIAGHRLPRLWPELTVLCCVALVWAAGYSKGFTFAPGPWRSTLSYIGSRSFSLYLVHNPAAWLAREVAAQLDYLGPKQTPLEPLAFTAFALVLMALLAELTYRLIEVPWRNWGRLIAASEAQKARVPVGDARKRPQPVTAEGVKPA